MNLGSQSTLLRRDRIMELRQETCGSLFKLHAVILDAESAGFVEAPFVIRIFVVEQGNRDAVPPASGPGPRILHFVEETKPWIAIDVHQPMDGHAGTNRKGHLEYTQHLIAHPDILGFRRLIEDKSPRLHLARIRLVIQIPPNAAKRNMLPARHHPVR